MTTAAAPATHTRVLADIIARPSSRARAFAIDAGLVLDGVDRRADRVEGDAAEDAVWLLWVFRQAFLDHGDHLCPHSARIVPA